VQESIRNASASFAPTVVELDWRTGAQDDIRGIEDQAVRTELAIAVIDVALDPFIGEELEYLLHVGDLSDCRKLYVDVPPDQRPPGPPRYRIVYRMLPDEDAPAKVQIVSIGPRADEIAYKRALARLNRPIGKRKS
jgi:hypothetical protein